MSFILSAPSLSLSDSPSVPSHAALLNYETVKYFCNEGLERNNFAGMCVVFVSLVFFQPAHTSCLPSLHCFPVLPSKPTSFMLHRDDERTQYVLKTLRRR